MTSVSRSQLPLKVISVMGKGLHMAASTLILFGLAYLLGSIFLTKGWIGNGDYWVS